MDEVTTETTETPVEQSTNEAVQTDTAPKAFEIPTEAQELVGEGKKYQSPEDALKSVPHAQKHIETLESELASVKEELTKRQTTQELIDELKSGAQPSEVTPQEPVLNQDNLMALVNQALDNKTMQQTANQNTKSVSEKFTAQFGEAAESVYNKITKDTGISIEQLNKLSATSPGAVLKLAGIEPTNVTPVSSSGNVNTNALENKSVDNSQLSARVKQGATTKDLAAAWKIAGEKIKQQT
jgi:hypothetical protein